MKRMQSIWLMVGSFCSEFHSLKKRSNLLSPIPDTSGFTLIELLIVIAIIGILAALLMVNFIGVRQRARDAQRKTDLRQIQSALELYRSDVGSYPATSGQVYFLNSSSCPTSSSLSNNGTVYMKLIPCDPLISSGASSLFNDGNYYYYSSGGTSYTLATCLENTNDSDQNDSKTAPSTAADGTCSLYYELTNP